MKKNFRSNLFLLLLTLLPYYVICDPDPTGPDLCEQINSVETGLIILPDGTSQSVIQTKCAHYFKVDLKDPSNPIDINTDKFIQLEIEVANYNRDYEFNTLLIEKSNSKPLIMDIKSERRRIIDGDESDMNGFYNMKSYHMITVKLNDTMNELYFGFYKYYGLEKDFNSVNKDLTYTVKATASPTYQCQKGCNGNGDCNQDQMQCVCKSGFYDLDCSVTATELSLKNLTTKEIPTNSWQYYAMTVKSYDDNDLSLGIISSGPAEMRLRYNMADSYYLPNLYQSSGKVSLTADDLTKDIILFSKVLKSYKDRLLMIGIYNDNDQTIKVDMIVTLSEADDGLRKAIMYAMIGIAAVLIILWGIFSYLRYKIYREAEAMQRALAQRMAHRVALTKEELDQYFPKKKFEALQSSFPQTLCSVCLEDFHKETVCRQLYCEHIYHDTCIEAWLGNKDTCPNCKKEMNKNAIEEHLANPNKSNSENKPAGEGEKPAEGETPAEPEQKPSDLEQGPEHQHLNNEHEVIEFSQNQKPIEVGIAAQLEELVRDEEERAKSLSQVATNGERTPKKIGSTVIRVSPSSSTLNIR